MLMECLIERDGPTVMHINGFRYVFEADKKGRKVAHVLSGEHREWLERSGNFRMAEPEQEEPSQGTHGQGQSDTDFDKGEVQGDGQPSVILSSKGTPWTSRDSAAVAARRSRDKGGVEMDVVEVDGGFGLVVKGGC